MIYREFNGQEVSLLGMGCMRLPVLNGDEATIDEKRATEVIDCVYENGVNYFDTSYSYHLGASERYLGKVLKRYHRDGFLLASKMPGHEIRPTFNPVAIFEEQLVRCGVDHFEFYLLHNVYENSIARYMDDELGILDYLVEQKRRGRIRHLGFSTHAQASTLDKFLDWCGNRIDFVQLQLNFVDWKLQNSVTKYRMVTERGLGVSVMEPLRGGRLLDMPDAAIDALRQTRPDLTPAAWALRWAASHPEVFTVLSGMNRLEHAEENVRALSSFEPLTTSEMAILDGVADSMMEMQPCTGCRYCCAACPQGLDIPTLIHIRDDGAFGATPSISMAVDSMPDGKRPEMCLGCGQCQRMCPQNIEIPKLIGELCDMLEKLPHWADISRERYEMSLKRQQEHVH